MELVRLIEVYFLDLVKFQGKINEKIELVLLGVTVVCFSGVGECMFSGLCTELSLYPAIFGF
jgi:hypothetical protein